MRWIAVAALAASVAVAAPSSRAPTLTAAQVVEKNAAARGGLQAWRQVHTMVWVGRLESQRASGPGMRFILQQKRPNLTRFEINGQGQRSMRVFDGVRGWKVRANHDGGPDVKPYSLPETKYARAAQAIDGPLIDVDAKGSTVALEGIEKVDGRDAYHLDIKTVFGEHQEVWVDAETFLDVRLDRPSYNLSGGQAMVSVNFRNYKSIEGLQLPMTIEIGAGSGSVPDKIQIERVALNPPLDDHLFEQPGVRHRRGPGVAMVPPQPAASPSDPAAAPK